MPFVLSSFTVTFSLDGAYDGDREKPVEFLPVGVDIAAQRAQLDTDIATWKTNFNNDNARDAGVSDAWITHYMITEKWIETDNIPAFTGSENLYLEAQLQSVLESNSEKASTYIPAPAARIFVGDSVNTNQIDQSDAAYVAYGTMFTAGGGNCALSDGDQYQNPLNVTASGLRTVRSGKSF